MAQYFSYNENTVPSSEISIENINNINPSVFKRPVLAVLNPNQPRLFGNKKNPWSTDGSCSVSNLSDNPKFSIFSDESSHTFSSNDVKKEESLELPECVTKLFTYSENSKENDYWRFPKQPQVDSEIAQRESKWAAPFRDDVHKYLKSMETKCRPNACSIRRQPDISPSMRSVLIDWLIEVGEEYKLQEKTVHLAVTYTDRFLSKMSVLRGKLQLVGTTCMFIASKHEEIYPPELKDFVYITDNTYTKKQILRMEHLILTMLNFELSTPTAFCFLQIYGCVSSASEKTVLLAQFICEISMLEIEPYLIFSPSQIGASCLALANYTLGFLVWSDDLVSFSGYSLDDIKIIIQCLHEKYRNIGSYPQQAVREKYKSTKFQCVAEVECPSNFVL